MLKNSRSSSHDALDQKVEVANSIDEPMTSRSIVGRTDFPDHDMLDVMIASEKTCRQACSLPKKSKCRRASRSGETRAAEFSNTDSAICQELLNLESFVSYRRNLFSKSFDGMFPGIRSPSCISENSRTQWAVDAGKSISRPKCVCKHTLSPIVKCLMRRWRLH